MNNRKSIFILFLVMFIVMVGFGIIIPVLPFYAEKLGANTKELGFLLAVYSLMQFLFSPMWGRISDRIGRKPVIMIGISGLALSFFLMAIADQLWMLFVARILGGFLSSANMPTTMAYVADVTTPENRSKGMGMIGAAVGLGFVFGPAVGGIFSKISLSFPFYVAGFLSVFTFFFVLFVLKESLPKSKRQIERKGNGSRWEAFSGANVVLFFLQFFISLSLAGLETTFPYFAYNRAGLGSEELGYVFMIMGLAGAIVQGGLMGILSEKFGEARVVQGGIIVSVVGFGLILLTTNFLTATIFISVFGIGNGVIRPAVTTLLTKSTDSEQGSVTGLLSSFDSLGRIIGPPLGGALFDVENTLPYISGILLSVIAFTLFQFYKVKVKRTEG